MRQKSFSSARCGGASQLANYIEPSVNGDIRFTPSTDPSVTGYSINVYLYPDTLTPVTNISIGKPPVNIFTGQIRVNIAAQLNVLAEGFYTCTVVAISGSGSTENPTQLGPFNVPLV